MRRARLAGLVCACGLGATASLPAQMDMKIPVGLVVTGPANPSTFYAGTPTGLLKSTDAGRTWTQLPFYPIGRIQPPIRCLAVGGSANILYAGTDRAYGLFWRSMDGGRSWQSSGAAFPAGAATDMTAGIEWNTASPTTVYAQVKTASGYRILRSIDSGVTWTQTGTSATLAALYAANPALMYRASGMDVSRSVDAGLSWTPVGRVRQPQPNELGGVGGLDVSPLDSNRLVATMSGNYSELNGIFTSVDGGATWTRILQGNFIGVRYNRQVPAQVVAGDCCSNFSLYRSMNQGITWQELKIGSGASTVQFASVWIAPHPTDPLTALAPTATGVWQTVDFGASWTRVGTYRPTLVSDPDTVTASLAAHGASEVAMTVKVRALEDATLAVNGYALTPAQNEWMSAAAGKSSATAVDFRLKSGAVSEGTYQTTVHVAATGFFNTALEIPVRLDAVETAPAAHLLTGPLAGTGGYFDAMTVDGAGNLVVAGSYRIQRIERDGSRTTLAGTGRYGPTSEGGPAVQATLRGVSGLAYDPSGILYFLDDNDIIRKIDRNGILTRVVGSETGAAAQTGSPALSKLTVAVALAFDPSGVLYFATYNRIWKLRADNTLEVVAGGGYQTGEGTAGPQTYIQNVAGLASNQAGEILFSDSTQNRVRKVRKPGQVITMAGDGSEGFYGDGAAAISAGLRQPGALALDAVGNLYLADDAGHRVRRVRAADGQIESIAGVGLDGTAGACSPALLTPLNSVSNLIWRPDGVLAVNDPGNLNIYGVRLAAAAAGPVPNLSGGPVNGASYTSPVAPGAIFTLFGTALSATQATAGGAWPATLADSTVCFGDTAVPLYYMSPTQLSGQIPTTASLGQAWMRVFSPFGMSRSAEANIAAAAPGIFQYGENRAVAVNDDGQINGPTTPAAANSWITVYVTGVGAVDNPVATGQAAPLSPLSKALGAWRVTIGGKQGNVYFVGLTPGFIGLGQVNVQVPDLPAGDYQMVVEIGSAASPPVLLKVK